MPHLPSKKKIKKVLKADFPPGTETLVHHHLPASPVTLQVFAKWAALRHVCRRTAGKLNRHVGERRVVTKLRSPVRLEELGVLVGFRLQLVEKVKKIKIKKSAGSRLEPQLQSRLEKASATFSRPCGWFCASPDSPQKKTKTSTQTKTRQLH